MATPSIDNFDPGGDRAEIVRTIDGEGVYVIGGENPLTDPPTQDENHGPLDVGESDPYGS